MNFLLISLLFVKSIVKNEFFIPRIEVVVTIVTPQDQFYIEANLAYVLIYTICSIFS